jgi:MFS family permease
VSFICTAISYNLESGAGDALVYDSLKEIDEEGSYMKVSGRKEIFYQTASTISFLIGGCLAVKSYYNVFAITIIIALITVLQSFTFVEPSVGRNKHTNEGSVFIKQLKESIKVIKNDHKVGFLIVFSQSISAFGTCIFFYLQNYLKGNGKSEAVIGILYAVSSLAAAATAPQVYKIEKRIKEKGILLVIPFIAAACIWGVALSKYNYIFFILLTITESIMFVSINDYINKRIPSENRATILSFASMVFSFFMIIVFPVIGMIGDKFSLNASFKIIGSLSSILVLVNCLVLSIRKKKTQNEYNFKG